MTYCYTKSKNVCQWSSDPCLSPEQICHQQTRFSRFCNGIGSIEAAAMEGCCVARPKVIRENPTVLFNKETGSDDEYGDVPYDYEPPYPPPAICDPDENPNSPGSRLRSIEIEEELTYYPDAVCCQPEMNDYFNICDSCGFADPILTPNDLLMLTGKSNGAPITYKKKQRFEFPDKWETFDKKMADEQMNSKLDKLQETLGSLLNDSEDKGDTTKESPEESTNGSNESPTIETTEGSINDDLLEKGKNRKQEEVKPENAKIIPSIHDTSELPLCSSLSNVNSSNSKLLPNQSGEYFYHKRTKEFAPVEDVIKVSVEKEKVSRKGRRKKGSRSINFSIEPSTMSYCTTSQISTVPGYTCPSSHISTVPGYPCPSSQIGTVPGYPCPSSQMNQYFSLPPPASQYSSYPPPQQQMFPGFPFPPPQPQQYPVYPPPQPHQYPIYPPPQPDFYLNCPCPPPFFNPCMMGGCFPMPMPCQPACQLPGLIPMCLPSCNQYTGIPSPIQGGGGFQFPDQPNPMYSQNYQSSDDGEVKKSKSKRKREKKDAATGKSVSKMRLEEPLEETVKSKHGDLVHRESHTKLKSRPSSSRSQFPDPEVFERLKRKMHKVKKGTIHASSSASSSTSSSSSPITSRSTSSYSGPSDKMPFSPKKLPKSKSQSTISKGGSSARRKQPVMLHKVEVQRDPIPKAMFDPPEVKLKPNQVVEAISEADPPEVKVKPKPVVEAISEPEVVQLSPHPKESKHEVPLKIIESTEEVPSSTIIPDSDYGNFTESTTSSANPVPPPEIQHIPIQNVIQVSSGVQVNYQVPQQSESTQVDLLPTPSESNNALQNQKVRRTLSRHRQPTPKSFPKKSSLMDLSKLIFETSDFTNPNTRPPFRLRGLNNCGISNDISSRTANESCKGGLCGRSVAGPVQRLTYDISPHKTIPNVKHTSPRRSKIPRSSFRNRSPSKSPTRKNQPSNNSSQEPTSSPIRGKGNRKNHSKKRQVKFQNGLYKNKKHLHHHEINPTNSAMLTMLNPSKVNLVAKKKHNKHRTSSPNPSTKNERTRSISPENDDNENDGIHNHKSKSAKNRKSRSRSRRRNLEPKGEA